MSEEVFNLFDTDGNQTPEEEFYDYLRLGKMPKLYNLEYWLKHELSVYRHMKERGYLLTKQAANTRMEVPQRDIVYNLIKYYLQMHYLPRFVRTDGRPACDIDKVIILIISDDTMRKYLHQG